MLLQQSCMKHTTMHFEIMLCFWLIAGGPLFAEMLTDLIGFICTYGPEIARVVMECLGRVAEAFNKLPMWGKAVVIAILMKIAEFIIRTYRKMKEPSVVDSIPIYADDFDSCHNDYRNDGWNWL